MNTLEDYTQGITDQIHQAELNLTPHYQETEQSQQNLTFFTETPEIIGTVLKNIKDNLSPSHDWVTEFSIFYNSDDQNYYFTIIITQFETI